MLTVVIMIKNEAESIAQTLRPFLSGGIQHFFIFDTGSTDGTQAVVHALFKQYPSIHYQLKEEPFIDFANSRNRALALAEQTFAHVPFILMPDAEWHMNNVDLLVDFCKQQQTTITPLYLINIVMNNSLDFYTARLFRTRAHVRFKGVVHEVPSILAEEKVPSPIAFNMIGSSYGIEKSKQRWQRDLSLLLNEYKKNPQDPRNLFYLAQTYECLNDLPKAYSFYHLRAAINGFVEETFITVLRMGRIAEKLYPWEKALAHYHRAFSLRPHRAEPLVYIADHYWPDNTPLCYLYANHACRLPYPTHDILFVEKPLYDYTRFEILSRCAWYQNEFRQGLDATQRALQFAPDTPHLLSNLKLYQDKLNSMEAYATLI